MLKFQKKTEKILLLVIFLLVLGTKLYFAFQTPDFNSSAYFEQRQIESVLNTGFPISWDELSYSGRFSITSPVYYYIMSFFASIIGISLTMKILPNLLVSLLVIVIYLIVKQITKNSLSSISCAFFVGFIPILTSLTLLTASIYSLAFLLIFLALYFFINIKNKRNWSYFLLIILFLPFVHPITSLMLLGLIFYIILMKLDGFKLSKIEIETVMFSIFYTILALFLQYKEALIKNGATIVWQNIPTQLYRFHVSVLLYVAAVGLIPLVFGTYTIYKYTFEVTKSSVHVFIGLALATFLMLWLKFIQPSVGLTMIAICLVILSGEGLKLLVEHLERTKFGSLKFLIFSIIFIVFISSSVNHSIRVQHNEVKNVVDSDLLDGLEWIKMNTPINSVVFGTLEQGHLITGISKRKNVIDNNFILVNKPSKVLEEVNEIFSSSSMVSSIKILNKYSVNYLIIDRENEPEIISNKNCFKEEYDANKYLIYESLCKVELIV